MEKKRHLAQIHESPSTLSTLPALHIIKSSCELLAVSYRNGFSRWPHLPPLFSNAAGLHECLCVSVCFYSALVQFNICLFAVLYWNLYPIKFDCLHNMLSTVVPKMCANILNIMFCSVNTCLNQNVLREQKFIRESTKCCLHVVKGIKC